LGIHKNTHLQCDVCGKKFNDINFLETHKLSHLPDNDPGKGKFKCDVCGKCLSGASALSRHKDMHL
ncbi:hypothetical protein PENTCL1PPCAC_29021, partial [Pristionchus entomophagus]